MSKPCQVCNLYPSSVTFHDTKLIGRFGCNKQECIDEVKRMYREMFGTEMPEI